MASNDISRIKRQVAFFWLEASPSTSQNTQPADRKRMQFDGWMAEDRTRRGYNQRLQVI